jgi:hypothetical protein
MRKFNIAGKIIPKKHYYVDLTPQIKKLMALAKDGTYFVINRPRQFGKTTLLNFFAQSLQASKSYVPALLSFESFVQRYDITEAEFYRSVARRLVGELHFAETASAPVQIDVTIISSRDDFFVWLRVTCKLLSRQLILLIDEIDAVPETVVVGFLAGLREMYLARDRAPALYSVCLAGVHDIKNLKARYRDETQSIGSASPFNIAIDYELPPFSRKNIRQYFMQHTADTGQALVIANLIYVQALYQHFEEDIKDSEVGEIAAGNRLHDKRGRLDFRRVFDKFQAFMKSKGAVVAKRPGFEEAFGQLLLLSYLDILVNGKGWTFKEVQSGEGRIDVVCYYKDQKEIVELKIWRGERHYEAGLSQLAKYLGTESLDHGYLVVFDRRETSSKAYSFKEHKVSGKRIQAWLV